MRPGLLGVSRTSTPTRGKWADDAIGEFVVEAAGRLSSAQRNNWFPQRIEETNSAGINSLLVEEGNQGRNMQAEGTKVLLRDTSQHSTVGSPGSLASER